jgi:hypothetical protein
MSHRRNPHEAARGRHKPAGDDFPPSITVSSTGCVGPTSKTRDKNRRSGFGGASHKHRGYRNRYYSALGSIYFCPERSNIFNFSG